MPEPPKILYLILESYKAINGLKRAKTRLGKMLKDICPILIKGLREEAGA
jgi:hypothetical protein